MERVGKTLKKQSFRKVIIYFLTWCMVFNTSLPAVLATPSGGLFTHGTGTINPVAGGNTTVTVDQAQSIIQWGSSGTGGIDTSSAESLSFSQASGLSNSAVLNRIMSSNATQFDGTLNGLDMRIFIVNPAGVVFGDGATINVTQLVASGLDMSNTDFLNATGNSAQKMIFSGGSGDVTVNGTLDATNTGSLYLVGKNVNNNGSILCPNGLVVMAAGNAIQLGQPGSNVIVTLADLGDAGGDNVVTNNGTVGEDGSPVGKLVLAAGDVWSQAITNVKKVKVASVGSIDAADLDTIDAYSDGGSDAVSTVDIISGGDVTIDDPMRAYSSVNTGLPGDPENDAISTINIESIDGSVNINSQVQAYSQVYDDSGNADADISITAGQHVNINSTDYEYPVEAYAKAKYGSLNANADVDIDAGLNVNVYDGVSAYARTQYDSGDSTALVDIDGTHVDIYDKVEAMSTVKYNSGNGMADVMLHADQDVDVGGLVKSWTRTSYDSGNATSKTTVNTGSDVYVEDGSIESWAVTEDYSYSEGTGPNLDATVDIDAYGKVELGDEDNGLVLAVAKTGVNASGNMGTITSLVDIDAGLVDLIEGNIAAVAKTGQDSYVYAGDITATVDIKTIGYDIEGPIPGDIFVSDDFDYFSDLYVELSAIEAHAEAGSGIAGTAGNVTAIVNLDASGMLDVDDGEVQAEARVGYQQSPSQAGNLTAMLDIVTGAGDSVDIENSYVGAIAGPIDESPATIGDTSATVDIISGGDVDVYAEDDESGIYAEAFGGVNNSADVDVTANYGNVDVYAYDYSYAGIKAEAYGAENDNTATVTVTAKEEPENTETGHVNVTAEEYTYYDGYSTAEINSWTYDAGMNNTSTTTINADGDVRVNAINTNQEAGIGAYAGWDDESNTANVIITAGGNVEVTAHYSNAYIEADSWYGGTNTAGVDITANEGRVAVSSNQDSSAWIAAEAHEGDDNTSTVKVTTNGQSGPDDNNGDVILDAAYSSEAWIRAEAENADNSNSATTTINASENVRVSAYLDSNAGIESSADIANENNTADIEINAERVNVTAEIESNSAINAEAYSAYDEENSENKANVAVYTHAADVEPDEDSGDVLVEATMGSGASIEAQTMNANTNTSDVLVCADGDVRIYGMMGGDADILADAMNAYSTNTAKVRVGARGDEGVALRADDGTAYIESWAQNGYTNTAETIVCTKAGVEIVDKSQVFTSAGIIAEALNGNHTDAYVGICAQDDVMVMAGIGPEDLEGEVIEGVGGHAMIKAEASSNSQGNEGDPPTANAEVAVISHNGGVLVIDATNLEARTAEIISSAHGGYTNTAYTGVSAGGDLLNEEHPLYEEIQGTGVLVLGIGNYGHARILSETYDGYINTSDTVVCTPAEVVVEAEGDLGVAEIKSFADDGVINTATTQVYAGDVYVYNSNLYGEGGIMAYAQGLAYVPYLDDSFILSEYDGEYGYHYLDWIVGGIEGDDEDTAHLRIGDYSKRQDCPECPVCPCEKPIKPTPTPKKPKPMGLFIPAAPLPERLSFEISGYPALMSWVAKELGVDTGSIQIGVTNSLASAKDIQPFRRFTRLRAAAMILQDAGGAYINALAQVVFEYASSTTPPTEEQMASIADAIARNAGANNQYALAGKYLDALAEYVGILSDEMGFAKEQAVQMVIERYVNRLTDSDNPAVAAYLAARLAAMGG